MSTRVLLVDDQPVVRAGFRVLLDLADDLTVVGAQGHDVRRLDTFPLRRRGPQTLTAPPATRQRPVGHPYRQPVDRATHRREPAAGGDRARCDPKQAPVCGTHHARTEHRQDRRRVPCRTALPLAVSSRVVRLRS